MEDEFLLVLKVDAGGGGMCEEEDEAKESCCCCCGSVPRLSAGGGRCFEEVLARFLLFGLVVDDEGGR